MSYRLSKDALKKIENQEFEFLVQIIKIKYDDGTSPSVTLWDGSEKKKVGVTKQALEKIQQGLITRWSIIGISYYHFMNVKTSPNEKLDIKKKNMVLEDMHVKLDGRKIRKKIIFTDTSDIFDKKEGPTQEQWDIANSSGEDFFNSSESEDDLDEKMEENVGETTNEFDKYMEDPLPIDILCQDDDAILRAIDKERKKDNKNDDENNKNKEVVTVSKKQINIKDVNLTKLSELTVALQTQKITVKVNCVYPCNKTNFFFTIQGNEKSPLVLSVAYPFIGNKLRNKIQPGTILEITNANLKHIDSQHSVLCDDSPFEFVLNEFYKTKIRILSVISNDNNDKPAKSLPSSSVILPKQPQSNLKVKPDQLFKKYSNPSVKPFAIEKYNINFTPFSALTARDYKVCGPINVIGRVLSYTKCDTISISDRTQTIRHVKFVDMENIQLFATLWNKRAVNFEPPVGSLVQVLKAGIRTFQGKNELSVYDCSDIIICKEDQ